MAKSNKEDGTPKQYSSFLVELSTPEAANEVVERRLVEGYQLKTCSRYSRAGTLLQCFRCCQYGHISSRCTNAVKCSICAGDHDTREQQGPENTAPCYAACGKKEHTAWHPECKICQKEKEKAFAKLASMSTKYPVSARFEQIRAHTPTSVTLGNDAYQIIIRKRKILGEMSEATLNMSVDKNKSGKQGRPPLMAKLAEKKPGQQTIQFSPSTTEPARALITSD